MRFKQDELFQQYIFADVMITPEQDNSFQELHKLRHT